MTRRFFFGCLIFPSTKCVYLQVGVLGELVLHLLKYIQEQEKKMERHFCHLIQLKWCSFRKMRFSDAANETLLGIVFVNWFFLTWSGFGRPVALDKCCRQNSRKLRQFIIDKRRGDWEPHYETAHRTLAILWQKKYLK